MLFKVSKLREVTPPSRKSRKTSTVDESQSVRAYMTCRQYVFLKKNDFRHQKAAELFDGMHRGHIISALVLGEISSNQFSSETQEFLNKVDGAEPTHEN